MEPQPAGYSADVLQLSTQEHAATPLEHARQRQWAAQQSSSELLASEHGPRVSKRCLGSATARHPCWPWGWRCWLWAALCDAPLEERPCG